MNKNTLLIRKIVGTALLAALTIILTFISNQIRIGNIEINLSLIPIALASILYGPWYGLFIGLINGGLVLVAPGTSAFFAINPVLTIFTCLLKTGLGGVIAGLLFKLINRKNFKVAIVVSSLSVPFINTGLFVLFCLIGFNELFGAIVTIFLLINFAIELAINIILAPTIVFLIKQYFKNHQDYFNI